MASSRGDGRTSTAQLCPGTPDCQGCPWQAPSSGYLMSGMAAVPLSHLLACDTASPKALPSRAPQIPGFPCPCSTGMCHSLVM